MLKILIIFLNNLYIIIYVDSKNIEYYTIMIWKISLLNNLYFLKEIKRDKKR